MTESRFNKKAGGARAEGEGKLVFIRPADLARAEFKGVIAEGQFVEALPNQHNEGVLDFKLVVDAPLKVEGVDKEGAKYLQEIIPGDTVVVNGAGNLNFLMKEISPGNLCQINYLGKLEATSGKRKGTLMHNFEVMY